FTQQPRLGWVEARSQELLLGLPHACRGSSTWAIFHCFPSPSAGCRDRGLPSVPDPFPLDVRKLLVAGNRIQRIPEDFFIFYGDLVYLDFRNNSLRSLEDGTFSGSAKLAFLDLSYNNLTQLGAGAFRSAGRLVKLSLGNNRLAGVHEAAFETLESLQVLELNDNRLHSLSVAALDALPALRSLRLDGNPWLCDCDFAHLFAWIQENASKLPKGEDLWLHMGPSRVILCIRRERWLRGGLGSSGPRRHPVLPARGEPQGLAARAVGGQLQRVQVQPVAHGPVHHHLLGRGRLHRRHHLQLLPGHRGAVLPEVCAQQRHRGRR
uniref:Leucine rich repeat containing 38 n=1 Tax=Oryctolagus cuniculus TaxID=9986 RepID=A0A5F9DSN7_RABIT